MISYGALLIPVCVSSAHITFGSLRMEFVFMILGQSVALAASLAIGSDTAIQGVTYADLQNMLEQEKQVLLTHKKTNAG